MKIKMRVMMKSMAVTVSITMVVVEPIVCVGGGLVLSVTVGVGEGVAKNVGVVCGVKMVDICSGEERDGGERREMELGGCRREESGSVGEGIAEVRSGRIACVQTRGVLSRKNRKSWFSIASDPLAPVGETSSKAWYSWYL